MNTPNYVVQSVLVPKTRGVGPKRAEKKAEKITKEIPMKTTLEVNYYHNRYYEPSALEKKGYTRYASKKLSDGTILALAYRTLQPVVSTKPSNEEKSFHRYVPVKDKNGIPRLKKAD